MRKMREKTIATLLIAIFMISILTVSANAVIGGTNLLATGTAGTESRIVIDMPSGFKLGNLLTITWSEYLVSGYPPHVDVILDLDGDGDYDNADDSLVFEYAYNNVSHAGEGSPSYGALTGAWYQTFSDDGNGPVSVNDTSMAWATKGAPGPLGGTFGQYNFFFKSLADWKTGVTYTASGQAQKTIDSDSIVLRLEIEVDNWIIDTDAYVKDIVVTDDFVPPEPPKPKRIRSGRVYYELELESYNVGNSPHKLIVMYFDDSLFDEIYEVTLIIRGGDQITNFYSTYRVFPRHDYFCIYLPERVFTEGYTVFVYTDLGPVPILVASRQGIEVNTT